MPNWKKVITSGSDAALNSLYVTNAVTASVISSSYIDLDVLANGDIPAHKPGRIFFGSEDGALEVYNEEADITLQVGQEFWVRAYNKSGAPIPNGTPVFASGSQGDRIGIYPAVAEDHTSGVHYDNHIIGVTTHLIGTSEEGYVTSQGIVRGVNTSAFAAGDILYLQTGSAGLRNTPPPFPYDIIQVGYVAKSASPNGFIFVEPKEPVHFNNISGLSGSVQGPGDLWIYQSNNSWAPTKTLSGSYTIDNGGLTADSFTGSFSGSLSAPGSNGQVLYNSGSILQASSDLYYDEVNGRVGIGTTTPSEKLEIVLPGSGTNRERVLISSTFAGQPGTGYPMLELNQAASSGNSRLIEAYTGGTLRFSLDNDGDLYAASSVAAGTLSLSSTVNEAFITNVANQGIKFRSTHPDPNRGNVTMGFGGWDSTARVVNSNRDRDDLLIRRNLDGASTYSSNGSLLRLEKNVINVTSGDVNIMEWADDTLGELGVIKGDGKIGIGTTTPSEKLTVEGNISASNTIFSDNMVVGGGVVDGFGLTVSSRFVVQSSDTSDWFTVGKAGSGVVDFNGAGGITRAGGVDLGARFNIQAISDTKPTLSVRGQNGSSDLIRVSSYNQTSGDYFVIKNAGSIGIGTTSPSEKLTVEGNISASGDLYLDGALYDSNNSAGTSGQILSSTATGTDWIDLTEISGVDGTGTANYVAKWSDTDTITDSVIYDNGTNVGIGTTSPSAKLEVLGGDIVVREDDDGFNAVAIQADSSAGYLRLYRAGSQDIQLSSQLGTNNYINNGGNVGIGTTNPDKKLEVSGDIKISGGDYNGLYFENASGTTKTLLYQHASYDALVIKDIVNNADRVTFKNNGNVGIGTTSPSVKLQVEGSIYSNGNIRIEDTGDQLEFGNSNVALQRVSNNLELGGYDAIVFKSSNTIIDSQTERMRITSAGNVGIGTTSPSAKLEVEQSNSDTSTILLSNSYNNKGFRTGNGGYATFAGYQEANNTTNGAFYGSLIGLNTFYDGTNFYNLNQFVDPSSILFKDGSIILHTNDISASGNFTPNERVRITKTGKVGIGTTSPSNKLDVIGNLSATSIRLGSTASGEGIIRYNGGSGNGIGIVTGTLGSSGIGLFVDHSANNRNVGIGTTTPTEKLTVQGNISGSGDLYLNNTLLSNQENTDVDTGTETIATIPIADYDAAFFDFVIKNGTNLRAGTVYAVHDGTNVEFTETSTQDLGSTTDVTLKVDISGADLRLRATTTSDNWIIKSLVRAI